MIALRILSRPDDAPRGPDLHAVSPAGATIGRAPDCDIVLDDPTRLVSRRHAWIASDSQGHALLRCLSTISPTTVNGDRLAPGQECLLRDGDRLSIGGFELAIEALGVSVGRTRADPYAPTLAATPPPEPARPTPMAARVEPPLAASIPVAAPPQPTALHPPPPAAAPAPTAPPRLDQWFDLDTVPDPLGPESPLPALAGTVARGLSGSPPSDAPLANDPQGSQTVLMDRPPPDLLAAETAAAVRADLQALRHAFLRGAGLDPATSDFRFDAVSLGHLGAVFRAQVEGTLEQLRARTLTKRNLRTQGTGVGARENNPLKFAPDADEAMRLLLEPNGRPGFLPPVAAVRCAHHDLQVHQMAMAAGMRAAMLDLITQLGPDAIEAAADPPQGAARMMPALREAQLWHRLQQAHRQLVEHLDDTFDSAFGREFVRAYEAYATQLRADTAGDPEAGLRH